QALHLEVVTHPDAAAVVLRQTPAAHLLVRVHARRPHGEVGVDAGAVGEHHGVLLDRRHPGAQVQGDATPLELLGGVGAELGRERLEDLPAALHHLDLERVAVDLRVGRPQPRRAQLRQRTRHLHAGRATTHDDDAQPVVGPLRLRGALQADEEVVADPHRLGARVHGERELLRARRAEEVRGHARAHHEVVVTDPEVVEQPDLLRLVVRLDQVLVHHVQVLLLEPQAAQEVGDVPRVQAAGSHLVQQRLERVVDPPVDERDPHGRVAQRLDHGHPCEPTTHHDHVRQRLGRPGQGRLEAVLEVVRGLRVGRGMRWIRHRHESPPDRRRSHPLRLRAAPGLPWSVVSTSDTTGRALANGLRTRHLTMMGLGSAIGAGLFLGSGLGVAAAGPAVLLSYAIAGAIVVLVMRMLAEMAAALPSSGSFSVYAETALGRWAGFLLGWLYWFTIVMVLGVEVTGVAGIVHGWWPAVP